MSENCLVLSLSRTPLKSFIQIMRDSVLFRMSMLTSGSLVALSSPAADSERGVHHAGHTVYGSTIHGTSAKAKESVRINSLAWCIADYLVPQRPFSRNSQWCANLVAR